MLDEDKRKVSFTAYTKSVSERVEEKFGGFACLSFLFVAPVWWFCFFMLQWLLSQGAAVTAILDVVAPRSSAHLPAGALHGKLAYKKENGTHYYSSPSSLPFGMTEHN
ncbi:hypothetical protein RHMOL_Rhmol05G0133500 [Rhododendron molle]|uniref:Uncharacterized protein n=4 Tax=Rhododendron molle TaxID=49168 RepID=A0ACC0NQS8_RHOML|nr:hypothetical protein RHMOL_Rhmol05G0133500 [Rhododendron molle]KAI8554908.1 hypothetical protein RHMOL_Rhmol05G0133500 [Rhododendron molle]KAI8554909.1 hypothetical protein RHMOL_Rhmol05G0133500 [Rhododendron molle]KAI8554910.1 hypothetical protein RHMOL_Rhmol05G0133500 [Rhododendron molle]